ncbi:MAG: trigger factor [Clostridia bacterium]|nr:trigger factor [Clostridia bacterium]
MLQSAQKSDKNEYTIEISVGAEEFAAAVNKAYNKKKGSFNVPGFRKGHAPKAIIERMYGEGVFYDEAINEVFPAEYDKAVEESGIEPVDSPRDFDVKKVGKEGLELSFKVTVKPEIEVVGYKGIEATKPSAEVTDEEVEKDIETKREQNAREIGVEDRPSKTGDVVTIDFEGFVDGTPFEGGKGENYDLELGSGSFIPGFEEQCENRNVGDEFDVNVTFPEEYHEELAGKDATFKIKLHAIKEKKLPELDDEFVKDISEFDTLEELRADVRKTIGEQKADTAKKSFENSVMDQLADLVSAEIPDCMIDTAVENMLTEFRYNVEERGIPFDKYMQMLGMNEESIRGMYRPRAEKEVKTELALEKIAALENIAVEDDEIEEEFKKMAEHYGVKLEDVKAAITAERVAKDLKNRKAADLVLENAVEKAEEEKAGDAE